MGYVGFDDIGPCEPFEPAEDFQQVEALFAKEHEVSARASELEHAEEVDALLLAADKIMDEILEPGVQFEAMEDMLCSFKCDQLTIADGRVCWR